MSGREGSLAAAYERARPRLIRVAYAVLGSHAEAQDVVSDCWLRMIAADARDPVRDVAETVGRTPAAVRQLAVRARAHVSARAPRVQVGAPEHTAAVTRFLAAAAGGDLTALVAALDPDVVLTSDGGGQVSAARRPVRGADRVARFLRGLASMVQPGERVQVINVNGAPGLGVFSGDDVTTVVSLTISGDRISRVDIIRAPLKLGRPGG
jgi:RNA polymerase sigma-70 factor, ECF subfamily